MQKKKLLLCAMLFIPLCLHAEFTFQPKYVGDVHLGYGSSTKVDGMNAYIQRVGVGTVQGVSLNEWIQVGIGVDFNFYTHYYPKSISIYKPYSGLRMDMNEYIDLRGTYSFLEDFKVYLDLGLGVVHNVRHTGMEGANFFCQFGPGLQWKHLDFSFGLQSYVNDGNGVNTFFAKIGYCF